MHERLADALAAMTWRIEPEIYALAGFAAPPAVADWSALGAAPFQVVRDGDETTILGPHDVVRAVVARHPDARFEDDLAWIRFEAPMAWELVGFLARVCGELAAAGVPLGAVCGFSRDHLFVGRRHLPAARAVLERLFGPERAPS